MMRLTKRRKIKLLAGGGLAALFAAFWFSLPRELFPELPSPSKYPEPDSNRHGLAAKGF